MAKIPRKFSRSPVTPAFSNARIDPNTAAAPFRAAEQSTKEVFSVIQSELGQWGKLLQRKQAEQQAADEKNRKVAEGLYIADAQAKIDIGTGDILREASQQADGVTNLANIGDQQYQQLADSVLQNAPSDEARAKALKGIIQGRAKLYNNLSDNSIRLNNQINMDKIENTLETYENAAFQNPDAIESIKEGSAKLFETMDALGIPKAQKEQIAQTFNRNIDFKAASAVAEKAPFDIQKQLDSGAFDYLGKKAVSALKRTTKASAAAATKQAKEALLDVEKSMMLGKPLPADFKSRADLAEKAGLTEELTDISRLSEVSSSIAGKSLPELMGVSAEIKALANRGEVDGDTAKVGKLVKFVDSRIKSMQEDPFEFATNQGAFNAFPIVTDFTQLSPEEAKKRQFRALQIQDSYKVPSPALSSSEIDVAVSQLQALPGEEKVKVMQSINNLGPDTIKAVTRKMDRKDKGLGLAIRMSSIDPEISRDIFSGREALASGIGKLKPSEAQQESEEVIRNLAADEQTKQSILAGAKSYYSAQVAKGVDISFSEAVEKSGNLIDVDRSGIFSGSYRTTAPAPGMDSEGFEDFLNSSIKSNLSWREFGNGIPMKTESGSTLPLNRIAPSDFDYVVRSDGTYGIAYEGETVYNEKDMPLTVDLVSLYKNIN